MYGTADIVELHSQLYSLPTLHIFCLGDIFAGMNDVGRWTGTYIAMPIVDQFAEGCECITTMINYWLGLFTTVLMLQI